MYLVIVSAIDYLLLRRYDRRYIKNVKVTAAEEYVSQHRLLVGDVIISTAPREEKENAHTKAESLETE